MTIAPRKLFLIDGLGALLSVFLVGVVLSRFESVFGMPQTATYWLAALPCLFALYSFTCFLLIKENWRPYLRLIALANLLYCGLTMGLVIYFYQRLTVWGLLYFVGEVIVVIGLAYVELKTASRPALQSSR